MKILDILYKLCNIKIVLYDRREGFVPLILWVKRMSNYDYKISLVKGSIATVVVAVIDTAVQVVSTSSFDILDMTVRAVAVGLLTSLKNWYKNR